MDHAQCIVAAAPAPSARTDAGAGARAARAATAAACRRRTHRATVPGRPRAAKARTPAGARPTGSTWRSSHRPWVPPHDRGLRAAVAEVLPGQRTKVGPGLVAHLERRVEPHDAAGLPDAVVQLVVLVHADVGGPASDLVEPTRGRTHPGRRSRPGLPRRRCGTRPAPHPTPTRWPARWPRPRSPGRGRGDHATADHCGAGGARAGRRRARRSRSSTKERASRRTTTSPPRRRQRPVEPCALEAVRGCAMQDHPWVLARRAPRTIARVSSVDPPSTTRISRSAWDWPTQARRGTRRSLPPRRGRGSTTVRRPPLTVPAPGPPTTLRMVRPMIRASRREALVAEVPELVLELLEGVALVAGVAVLHLGPAGEPGRTRWRRS